MKQAHLPICARFLWRGCFTLCVGLFCSASGFAAPVKSPHDMAPKHVVKKSGSLTKPQPVSKGKPPSKENKSPDERTTPWGAPINPGLELIMEIFREAGKGTIKP